MTSTFGSILYKSSLVNLPMTLAFLEVYVPSVEFKFERHAKINTRLRKTHQRPRVRIEKSLYFDQNITDMSIDIP